MTQQNPPLTERWALWSQALDADDIPTSVGAIIQQLIVDICGLCIAASATDYVNAITSSCDSQGHCTAIGRRRTYDRFDAALINGTAAHGEDFDDTFEGTPVHVGAVLIPAVMATIESMPHQRFSGNDVLRAIALGGELSCRLALVTPMAIHRAGFHPTAVIGAMGSALCVSHLLKLDVKSTSHALGLAGSMASGIIEYLAEGTWTKRVHAGWAAQSGLRAALLARSGFIGPRTVFEGQHGFFHAFTQGDVQPDFRHLSDALGEHWELDKLAFKPYPCGTMVQPFIDCALQLHQQGISAQQIKSIVCPVGEGTVHRLWEPLKEKRSPSSPYSAKFSVPFGIAVAIVDGTVGLDQFEASRVNDSEICALAQHISYTIDADNEYPRNYSGHLCVELHNGDRLEFTQPHLRGGSRERLPATELVTKFHANAARGNWSAHKASHAHQTLMNLFQQEAISDLAFLRE